MARCQPGASSPSPGDRTARRSLSAIDPDAPDPANLWRVHWFNDASRTGRSRGAGHLVLPAELTGVEAPIVVLLGRRFPMIGAHKVLAAYACLVPRLVDRPLRSRREHKAVWPSTGNYCRGGVAISRILGCRGVAVLPAGMSRERFDWLRAVGRAIPRTSSARRARKATSRKSTTSAPSWRAIRDNVILNQFSEFANYLDPLSLHRRARSIACSRIVQGEPAARSARGVCLGDRLGRHDRGRRLSEVAPRHADRRGRGDRVPDDAVQRLWRAQHPGHRRQAHPADPQRDEHRRRRRRVRPASDALNLLFGSDVGRSYLAGRRKIDPRCSSMPFDDIGISGLANIVAAIKLAKHLDLGADDVIMTVATDSAALYGSERQNYLARALSRRVRRGECRRDLRPLISRRSPTITCSNSTTCRPQAHLQSRLLHLGRAAGRGARRFRPRARTSVLARARRQHSGLGSPDRGVQRGGRRACP